VQGRGVLRAKKLLEIALVESPLAAGLEPLDLVLGEPPVEGRLADLEEIRGVGLLTLRKSAADFRSSTSPRSSEGRVDSAVLPEILFAFFLRI
jgi:hypothetical protein